MSEFEILCEGESTGSSDISVGLEHVHGECVSGEEETTDELSEHVESDLHVRYGIDDTGEKE